MLQTWKITVLTVFELFGKKQQYDKVSPTTAT